MSENRLPDYLDHIQQAATDARSFVEGMAKDDFLADKRTQQAVIMSLIVIGEAATKVMDGYVEFTQAHADVPWRSMRNMRNRMAHGYFDINLDVVWETVQEWLPALLQQFPPCVRMPTMKTVTTKAWSHDQSSRRCSAPLACSIPRPMSRARARPSGWPQRTRVRWWARRQQPTRSSATARPHDQPPVQIRVRIHIQPVWGHCERGISDDC